MATLEVYLAGQAEARQLLAAVVQAVEAVGGAEMRMTKSQAAFYRRRAFAWAWAPRLVLRGRGASLVLTLALRRRDASPRWKEVVEPRPGRFTHHLELYHPSDLDEEALGWLKEAWEAAG